MSRTLPLLTAHCQHARSLLSLTFPLTLILYLSPSLAFSHTSTALSSHCTASLILSSSIYSNRCSESDLYLRMNQYLASCHWFSSSRAHGEPTFLITYNDHLLSSKIVGHSKACLTVQISKKRKAKWMYRQIDFVRDTITVLNTSWWKICHFYFCSKITKSCNSISVSLLIAPACGVIHQLESSLRGHLFRRQSLSFIKPSWPLSEH